MLHHDIAPAHASSLIREFLTKNEITVVPQPPYSPDLVPAYFFLFPKLKSSLKGQRFESTEEIEKNSLTELLAIPKIIITGLFPKLEKTLGGFY
jgi:transposase